jgi:hypothetical protein
MVQSSIEMYVKIWWGDDVRVGVIQGESSADKKKEIFKNYIQALSNIQLKNPARFNSRGILRVEP